MEKKFLALALMVFLLSHADISSADGRSDCIEKCKSELAACREKVLETALQPYTAEEQQQLDECNHIMADCRKKCDDDELPPEPVRNEQGGSDSGVPEGSGDPPPEPVKNESGGADSGVPEDSGK